MDMKKLIKVGWSEGGGVQLDFLLKRGRAYLECYYKKKYCVSMHALNLFRDLFVSCLQLLVAVGTKDKTLMRTENSSSVNL